MSKKITDENGKTYVEKKPFYKKGCFWIVAVVAVIIIAAVAGGAAEIMTMAVPKSIKQPPRPKSQAQRRRNFTRSAIR